MAVQHGQYSPIVSNSAKQTLFIIFSVHSDKYMHWQCNYCDI